MQPSTKIPKELLLRRKKCRERSRRWRQANPEKNRERSRRWRKANIEKHREFSRRWQQAHRKQSAARSKAWRIANPERFCASTTRWRDTHKNAITANRKRYYQIPKNRLMKCLRHRLQRVLSGQIKAASALQLLGCPIESFQLYLQSRFLPGMAWSNYGYWGWHVDHIRPCTSFDLSDPEQQRICFHFSNLQPLWGPDNLSKGIKLNWKLKSTSGSNRLV